MSFIFPTENTSFVFIRFFLYLILGILFGYFEYSQKFQLSYSKFNKSGNIDSQKGMVFIYGVPILVFLFYARNHFFQNQYSLVLSVLLVFHFGKRVLESVWVHKYSGKISLLTLLLITYFYSAIAYIVFTWIALTPQELVEKIPTFSYVLGIVLFVIGQTLNFYHHVLLANLRKDSREYKIPEAGFFKRTFCPHYFFEILSWLGLAICSQYLLGYAITFIMFCYLFARSINTKKWYIEKFPSVQFRKKLLIPGIL